MHIHPLTPQIQDGELRISARIELDAPPYNVPKTIWFSVPEAYAHLVGEHADGFAIALVATALPRGENIHIHGDMSPALMYGLRQWQYIQTKRKPWAYKPIELSADSYTRRTPGVGKAASTFSGGVDSTFTVWSHLARNEPLPGNELAYTFFAHGFDIPLQHIESYALALASYKTLMAEWGIELVPVRTNVRLFEVAGQWVSAITYASIALGFLLDRGISRYYVPANDYYNDYPKGAVATLADLLLSDEHLHLVEDGARFSRLEKIRALSQLPETYDRLRVCWLRPHGTRNCCRCSKCLSVMTALEVCGALQHYTSFPLPLTRRWRAFSGISPVGRDEHWDYFHHAMALRRYDVALDVGIKLALDQASRRVEGRPKRTLH